MEKYFNLASGHIHSLYSQAINNAIHALRKNYWKEGTKPQNKQLLAVQTATKELEDLFENYLQTHIKAVRALNYHCSLTTECLNGIQELRKKGIISLLKRYDPHLGVGVETPRMPKMPELRSEMYQDGLYGVYERDWVWATIGGTIGKCPNKHLIYPGIEIITPSVVDQIGHVNLNKQSVQPVFNNLLAKIKAGNKLSTSVPSSSGTISIPNSTYGSYYVPIFDTVSPTKTTEEPKKSSGEKYWWEQPKQYVSSSEEQDISYSDKINPIGYDGEQSMPAANYESSIEQAKKSLDEMIEKDKQEKTGIFEQLSKSNGKKILYKPSFKQSME